MRKIIFLGSLLVFISLLVLSLLSTFIVKSENNSNDYKIEILDISFDNFKIIATIKSTGYNIRTLPVDFYKSCITGINPTESKYIGTYLATIHSGDTIDVPYLWLGLGYYKIQVNVEGFDESSQDVMWFLFFGWEVN